MRLKPQRTKTTNRLQSLTYGFSSQGSSKPERVSMIKFHLDRLFRRWLRENRHRFTHPPYIVRACHSHLELAFSGISPRVWATLKRNSEVSVGISYKGECWDLVRDFDAYAKQRSSDGWFCRLCAEQGKQELFPSCDALF